MESMSRIKQSRRGHRTQANRLIGNIKTLLSKDALDVLQLEARINSLEKQKEGINKLDERTQESIEEDELELEIEQSAIFMETLEETLLKAGKVIERIKRKDSNEAMPTRNPQTAKLPKLELPKFNGDPFKWHEFWDVYSATVHDREDLSDAEKLQYLKGQLTGEAAKTIGGFRMTGANYETITELLHNTYGDRETIIDAHMLELVQLAKPQFSTGDITRFRTDLESHIHPRTWSTGYTRGQL